MYDKVCSFTSPRKKIKKTTPVFTFSCKKTQFQFYYMFMLTLSFQTMRSFTRIRFFSCGFSNLLRGRKTRNFLWCLQLAIFLEFLHSNHKDVNPSCFTKYYTVTLPLLLRWYGGVHECTVSSSEEQQNVILLDIRACVSLNISSIQKTVQQQLEHFSFAFALIYHVRIKVVT